MIEKLKPNEDKIFKTETGECLTIPELGVPKPISDKINELVDAVNAIQKEREAERFEIREWIGILEVVRKSVNIHEKQIGDLQNRITAFDDPTYHEEPAENGKCSKMENIAENGNFAKNAQDTFAKQCGWVGCVCRFWYDNPDDTVLDYLGKIQTGKNGIEYYGKETYNWFPHCEPVKPDDDIIYKGE